MQMTFHESYGSLPVNTLRLIRKHNVSPADLDNIIDYLLIPTWGEVDVHIVSHSEKGMYNWYPGKVG